MNRFGLILVDKPTGPTSHKVVSIVRKETGVRKVGHAGTLDPRASGVLVLCLGSATRLSEYLSTASKRYEAVIRFGASTKTYDAEGDVIHITGAVPTEEDIHAVIPEFSGMIEQIPPPYSAIKVKGKKAYEMAGLSPEDINLAEVHDCFTIAEIMAIEDLGFFQKGEGWKAAMERKTARDGVKPINTSGGLKSKGHPVGASGLGQVNEIWEQLHGNAGDRQIAGNPRIGLTHNVGGSGQTCVVNIFERRN